MSLEGAPPSFQNWNERPYWQAAESSEKALANVPLRSDVLFERSHWLFGMLAGEPAFEFPALLAKAPPLAIGSSGPSIARRCLFPCIRTAVWSPLRASAHARASTPASFLPAASTSATRSRSGISV